MTSTTFALLIHSGTLSWVQIWTSVLPRIHGFRFQEIGKYIMSSSVTSSITGCWGERGRVIPFHTLGSSSLSSEIKASLATTSRSVAGLFLLREIAPTGSSSGSNPQCQGKVKKCILLNAFQCWIPSRLLECIGSPDMFLFKTPFIPNAAWTCHGKKKKITPEKKQIRHFTVYHIYIQKTIMVKYVKIHKSYTHTYM